MCANTPQTLNNSGVKLEARPAPAVLKSAPSREKPLKEEFWWLILYIIVVEGVSRTPVGVRRGGVAPVTPSIHHKPKTTRKVRQRKFRRVKGTLKVLHRSIADVKSTICSLCSDCGMRNRNLSIYINHPHHGQHIKDECCKLRKQKKKHSPAPNTDKLPTVM